MRENEPLADRPSPRERSFRQRLPDARASRLSEPAAPFVTLGLAPQEIASWETLAEAFPEPRFLGPAANERGDIGAAVLLPLYKSAAGLAELAFIRRAGHLRSNPGEIAFAGGRLEEGESPLQACLREAEEEVALPMSSARPLAMLPLVERASRPLRIAAFAATVEGAPCLSANPAEVAEVFVWPLVELVDPERYWEEIWSLGDGRSWRMHFYERGDDVVWGASASILTSLLDTLAQTAASSRGRGRK